MVNIVLITGNENKRKEIESILGNNASIINIKIDLPEIQTISVEEVITEKIKYALSHVKNPEILNEIKNKFSEQNIIIKSINDFILICEDTGVYIKKMNNFPGALIKFYFESVGNDGIIKRDHGSKAEVVCVIGIVSKGKIVKPIIGKVKGKIAKKNLGDNGFGWDASFIPNLKNTKYDDSNGKSYAELSDDIKNNISHRYIAFNNFKKKYI
jgi:non-canonical purine NTP pyrophosphatase (RdgB/HAM1 family)